MTYREQLELKWRQHLLTDAQYDAALCKLEQYDDELFKLERMHDECYTPD